MKEKKKSKKVTLIVVGITSLIIILIGSTYAYWRVTKWQENENIVNSACLNVTIESEKDEINLPKAYPISDEDGQKLIPFKFKVTNNCQANAQYQINLESMSKNDELEIPLENRLKPQYLKFQLKEENKNGIMGLLSGTEQEDTNLIPANIENAYEAHQLSNGYLKPGESKNYELRLWLHNEVPTSNAVMNKTFVSKISVISTYINDENIPPTVELALSVCENTITASATGNVSENKTIEKYEYNIDNQGWNIGNQIEKFENQNLGSHSIKVRVTDNNQKTSEEVESSITIEEAKTVDIKGQMIPIATCKNGLYEVTHQNINNTSNDSGFTNTEYRYAGVNYVDDQNDYVHNYVKFNNENWRIIGLVNVKTLEGNIEQRLKIIRDDSIGKYYGGEYQTSSWDYLDFKNLLNNLYYNSTNGDCYNAYNYESYTPKTSTCNFSQNYGSPKGLNADAQKMIDQDLAWPLSSVNNYYSPIEYYEKERSIGEEWSKNSDRDYHNGVGLLMPSDYGYTTNGGDLGREQCLNTSMYTWSSANRTCDDNSWLNEDVKWTMTPSDNASIFAVGYGITISSVTNEYAFNNIYPVVYLKKEINIISGEGTKTEPYTL